MRISPVSKVKSSPMANVQSPTSPETPEDYGIRGGAEDAGHRTLDIEPGLTVTDLRKSFFLCQITYISTLKIVYFFLRLKGS